ncbi:DNA-directed RNA polymerase subunit beta [Treponema pallidum]|uniref:DNA-directed RNA polymerase subunit beta n=4 Tax=Treponema pallidum TaxID=160 RepID=A0AAU8RLG8_TREPL|nr:DNA-directed RNA polymerase subunit beta [Treponema pallidum]AEZ57364.1 DNA-directed RNA polymerase subunit beta [Treponema pallidum subsp. pertenue str. SamoaD]AEZ58433.1 DNA-directed RNA polymerase subunit beta [Treponema pallidum subsp. pertenue str. CDC2]AEZ59501.1 DNA-directed RNA polymerase subunit beta [Treponema pallidum subsp. pertenue str. Gauthier]AGK83889.1 DNA-directed RNA polymerase subunit beta [Treponema pallidum str. Fribourg-Blanc]AJB40264.1 DNA-directed RNA polymerase sub
MSARVCKTHRVYVGKDVRNFMDIPDLIEIQLRSYDTFLHGARNTPSGADTLISGTREELGLEDVFKTTFPIESSTGDMTLEYQSYSLDEKNIKFSEAECKQKGLTYAIPLKALVDLRFNNTGEIRRKDIYMGDIPKMTERGTFIINGAERVVVSQIHRSPGVVFSHEKDKEGREVFSSRIIPYRGSWLEFEIDQKKDLIYAKLDKKRRILGTVFLRALHYETREQIIEAFYAIEKTPVCQDRVEYELLTGKILARSVTVENEQGETRVLYKAGEKIHPHVIDDLLQNGICEVYIINLEAEGSLRSAVVINCLEREEMKFSKSGAQDELSREEALCIVYSALRPSDPMTMDAAEKDLQTMFFSPRRYDLGRVGRYKLNKKFRSDSPTTECTLTLDDIVNTMKFLIRMYSGDAQEDDIDHLGNRRIRSVGELMTNTLKTAFLRMERIAKERMSSKETETIKPQDLISIKPIMAAIKEFFGASQLSQFMDQVNPLAELTHKRRLNALGPGGLSRERAGFEVRDVHYTHYGRMCPIETPEGPNIGLIVSMANYARVNGYGFLEVPYVRVRDGVVTKEIEYLDAMDEDRYYIGQDSTAVGPDGVIRVDHVSCRHRGDYSTRSPKDIQYMDVSPKQIISVSASLIPFLEHDDANRALMGSNMQRQGVPLIFPEPPRVGTGMEEKCAYDSGVLVKAKQDGTVAYVSSEKIVVCSAAASGEEQEVVYPLLKYQRTNQDTCYHQRPIVHVGDRVQVGDALADGPATYRGELALGRNILVGFVPWNGYNYEDAILISHRVVKEDMFTSVHIKEFSTEVRETKLGSERMTNDIPNKSEKNLDNLDAEGIIRIGSKVRAGDVLIGKITPKSESETTPEFRLLNSIFGEKAKEVRDSSLRVPHGVEGTVIDVQRLRRSEGDDLNPGVSEVVKVLIATKRKLREGDKMAGRHGNKGIVARILPEEDMPYLDDGTPLDVCLNPLGVPSRMNIGQILESELGLAGLRLDEWYESPVFQSPSNEQIGEKLMQAGFPTNSKVMLRDGRTGDYFQNPVFVGVIYFMKLAHLVDDKMHARSTGPYSLVTQQPLGGKAQFGGQRLGEMEVWALEAYGAANTLQELLTIKSDDMHGRSKIYEAIVKGEASSPTGIPESFNVLVQELRGLALDFTIYDAKGKQIPLTERDEEMTNKIGSKF